MIIFVDIGAIFTFIIVLFLSFAIISALPKIIIFLLVGLGYFITTITFVCSFYVLAISETKMTRGFSIFFLLLSLTGFICILKRDVVSEKLYPIIYSLRSDEKKLSSSKFFMDLENSCTTEDIVSVWVQKEYRDKWIKVYPGKDNKINLNNIPLNFAYRIRKSYSIFQSDEPYLSVGGLRIITRDKKNNDENWKLSHVVYYNKSSFWAYSENTVKLRYTGKEIILLSDDVNISEYEKLKLIIVFPKYLKDIYKLEGQYSKTSEFYPIDMPTSIYSKLDDLSKKELIKYNKKQGLPNNIIAKEDFGHPYRLRLTKLTNNNTYEESEPILSKILLDDKTYIVTILDDKMIVEEGSKAKFDCFIP